MNGPYIHTTDLQVLHHLPPGLQLVVEGEQVANSFFAGFQLFLCSPQVTLVQEEGYQLVTQT